MKLNSITCAPDANCAAVACHTTPGPPMEHAVLGAPWLETAAHTMALQDKVGGGTRRRCKDPNTRAWCRGAQRALRGPVARLWWGGRPTLLWWDMGWAMPRVCTEHQGKWESQPNVLANRPTDQPASPSATCLPTHLPAGLPARSCWLAGWWVGSLWIEGRSLWLSC